MLQNGRVYRGGELEAGKKVLSPTNDSFERVQLVKFNPNPLIQARPLHELDPAAINRQIENVHAIVCGTGATELHLRNNWHSRRPA